MEKGSIIWSKDSNLELQPGSLVWARIKGYPSWPAMVENDLNQGAFCNRQEATNNVRYHVTFFGTQVSRAWVSQNDIQPFIFGEDFPRLNGKLRKFMRSLTEAFNDANTASLLSLLERLKLYGFTKRYVKSPELVLYSDDDEICEMQDNQLENSDLNESNEIKDSGIIQPMCIQTEINKGGCSNKCEYLNGTLVLVEVPGYPKWPAIVSIDPDCNRFNDENGNEVQYHVTFLHEVTSRSWIKYENIRIFHLAEKVPTVPKKHSVLLPNLKKAFENARQAFLMTHGERVKKFCANPHYSQHSRAAKIVDYDNEERMWHYFNTKPEMHRQNRKTSTKNHLRSKTLKKYEKNILINSIKSRNSVSHSKKLLEKSKVENTLSNKEMDYELHKMGCDYKHVS